MNAIVAVDNKWGIGKANGLLFHIPEDLNYFKEITYGKVIVMGYNTLISLPGSKPLKARTNIVLHEGGADRDDCIVVKNFDSLKKVLSEYKSDDIFIVGGAMFYKSMLKYCQKIFVTKVDSDGKAELFFENLDAHPDFVLEKEGAKFYASGYEISYNIYKNNNALPFI